MILTNTRTARLVYGSIFNEVREIGLITGHADFELYHYVERRYQDDDVVFWPLMLVIQGLL